MAGGDRIQSRVFRNPLIVRSKKAVSEKFISEFFLLDFIMKLMNSRPIRDCVNDCSQTLCFVTCLHLLYNVYILISSLLSVCHILYILIYTRPVLKIPIARSPEAK